MIARLGTAALALLIAIDVMLCTIWLAPLYVVGLADKPSGRQLISQYVGEAAINGHRWALLAEAVIDAMFFWNPGHCRATFRKYGGS